jgi:hypothetical protein
MRRALAILLVSGFVVITTSAQQRDYGPVNVSAATVSGDQFRGPARVRIVGINVVQKNVEVGVNVSYPQGPDLSLPFVPKLPSVGSQTTTAPAATPTAASMSATANKAATRTLARNVLPNTGDVGPVFGNLVNDLNQDEGSRFALQQSIQTGIDTVNEANTQVNAFVSSSSIALAADPNGVSLLSQIPPLLNTVLSPALAYHWPSADVAVLETDLATLRNNLVVLQDNSGWAGWIAIASNKTSYDAVVSRVNELINLASALESTNNKSAATLNDLQNKLQQWSSLLSSINAAGSSAFSRTVDTTCGFGFANNKNSVVELKSTDRMAATGTTPVTLDLVTIICSSPLSISGGFGFSTVSEREVSFIQSEDSSGTVISTFGYKAKSNFKPLPLLLLNTRIHEWNDDWAIHVSNGAVVDIKTGAASSTDVEFVSGLSVSYRRSLFVTGGFHAGRIQSLAGGFTIGQQVPLSVSTPPTQARWAPGFVLAFTYKLK